METKIEKVTLKMWERTLLPETEQVDGKRIKTGRKVEMSTYTFTDEYGSKLVFLSDNEAIRNLEGQTGELFVTLVHDDFNKRNKIQFKGFLKL